MVGKRMIFSDATIEKAMNMRFEKKAENIYYTNPTTDKDNYKHKIIYNKGETPICDCTWYRVSMNRPNKLLCSHALGILYKEDRVTFWSILTKNREHDVE